MNDNMMQYFRLIGKIQKTIMRAQNLREAMQESLKIIAESVASDQSIVWYVDPDGASLHPYYWIGDRDITSRRHAIGAGAVGRAYERQQAVRELHYISGSDPEMEADFPGMKIRSMLCVPFSADREDLGCIQLISTGEEYTEEMADTVEILAYMIALSVSKNENIQPKENENIQLIRNFDRVILSVRNIHKSFVNGDTSTHVLRGVNLDIYEGEFLVILGESGCGKSTLLNIISGLDRADSGTFSFDGEELSTASEKRLAEFRRNNVGFIFQNYNLMPNLTARQNLNLIGELVPHPMAAEEALALVGLSDKMNNYPSQLSGGQQQRVSIARALVKKPRIIFADEPTAALDYATGIEVLGVLEKVLCSGTTLVMVTHNEEITKMADRVVCIRQGKTQEITINRRRAEAKELVW